MEYLDTMQRTFTESFFLKEYIVYIYMYIIIIIIIIIYIYDLYMCVSV